MARPTALSPLRNVTALGSALALATLLAGCHDGADASPPDAPDAGVALDAAGGLDATDDADAGADLGPLPPWPARPALVTRPDRKAAILAHADVAPWSGFVADLRGNAAGDCVEDTNAVWDIGTHVSNAYIAQANAVLAWLFDDAAAAGKARACLRFVRTDWETSRGLNHAMAPFSIASAVAWDLMAGTSMFPAAEAAEARRRLVLVNEKFFDRTAVDPANRWAALTVTQNNITIRSSAAMAYVALAFPDEPRSREILDFAAGELDYLWGPKGRYIEDDGVVSEEPFYFGYGFPPALAFFAAMRNAWPADRWLGRTCINRNDKDPWAPIDCVEGEAYRWEDPLAAPGANPHADRLWSAFDWSLDHRMPSGLRSTTGDGAMRTQNAGLLLAAFSGRARYAWDARRNDRGGVDTDRGLNLLPQHLFEIDAEAADDEPAWTSSAHRTSGHVTLRSDWGPDALWLLALAESGPARKTLHDHADGTSYALWAYGEYLLLDAGYYKPDSLANAVTADAPSHNVILIDGQGAPKRGLLNNFGDADASLDRFVDGPRLDYAEVSQSYESTTIHRSVVMVRNRYALVADRLETQSADARDHAWRVNGFAGYDSGGSYALDADGVTFTRAKAGLRVAIASNAGEPVVGEPPYVENAAPHVHAIGDDPGTSHHAVGDAVVRGVAPGFLAVLAPWKAGAAAGAPEAPLTVTRLASTGGTAAFTVSGAHGTDVVWLRTPTGPATLAVPGGKTLTTDAELVVANLDDGLLLYRGGTGVTWDGAKHTGATAAPGLAIADVP